ncbi:DnaJ-like protein [Acanthamoeba polyphaga mimivirus]|uniref:DnaJ-like protein n=1 Tax=Acanthamoeba polyphaga mimivirus Kroon TaxID=3069720 RepID=A0A0G2Y639_9VIRU|nr:DnaJ-like protein [Acanthamoeba polyphaga mimivirus]AKI79999.1 DnaJ-like protein [Acanthamoeba polyphaga mimivirus Kroon]
MERNQNYYQILDVDNRATKQQIIQSYKKLVRKYHPDRNKNPEAIEKFKQIQSSYEVLSDDLKRLNYDSYLTTYSNNNNFDVDNDLFNYYFIMKELFDKYDLNEEEQQEILDIFNIEFYQNNINTIGIDKANEILINKLIEYIPKITIKRISGQNKYFGSVVEFIFSFIN